MILLSNCSFIEIKRKVGIETMEFLFNSKGKHIANLVNGQLHAPSGQNIGHYMPKEKNIH